MHRSWFRSRTAVLVVVTVINSFIDITNFKITNQDCGSSLIAPSAMLLPGVAWHVEALSSSN